jgi:hypothetical protein
MTNYLAAQYPLSMSLNIRVIDAGPGFDVNDLKKKLGALRFGNLIAGLKREFVCNHDKDMNGNEVPCVYATDLESFLKAGG